MAERSEDWHLAFERELKSKSNEHLGIMMCDIDSTETSSSNKKQRLLLRCILFEDSSLPYHWRNYIEIVREAYPTRKLQIQRLINKAIEKIDEQKYQHDSDFVAIHLMIAKSKSKDTETLRYFQNVIWQKEIGRTIARVYLDWAEVEKRVLGTKAAVAILEKGLGVNALPRQAIQLKILELKTSLRGSVSDLQTAAPLPLLLAPVDRKKSEDFQSTMRKGNTAKENVKTESQERDNRPSEAQKIEHFPIRDHPSSTVGKRRRVSFVSSLDLPAESAHASSAAVNGSKESIPTPPPQQLQHSPYTPEKKGENLQACEKKSISIPSSRDNLPVEQADKARVSATDISPHTDRDRLITPSEGRLPFADIEVPRATAKDTIPGNLAEKRRETNTTSSSNRYPDSDVMNNRDAVSSRGEVGRIFDDPTRRVTINGKNYLKLQLLGRGGSSSVHRIISEQDGQIYAFKHVQLRQSATSGYNCRKGERRERETRKDVNNPAAGGVCMGMREEEFEEEEEDPEADSVFESYANEISLLQSLRGQSISKNNNSSSNLNNNNNNNKSDTRGEGVVNNAFGVSSIIELYDFELRRRDMSISMVLEIGDIDLAKVLSACLKQPFLGIPSLHQAHSHFRFEVSADHEHQGVGMQGEGGSNVNARRTPQALLDPFFCRLVWREMLEAVQYIHEHRVVHGDLKPANFVFVRGRLKLIDFGIAKSISADTTNIYRDNQVGTINYMAPEAIAPTILYEDSDSDSENNNSNNNNNLELDKSHGCDAQNRSSSSSGGGSHNGDRKREGGKARKTMRLGRASDVWSLGCILYQMTYGRPPFAALNTIQKLSTIPNPKHQILYPTLLPPTYFLDHCTSRARGTNLRGGQVVVPNSVENEQEKSKISVDLDAIDSIQRCLAFQASRRSRIVETFDPEQASKTRTAVVKVRTDRNGKSGADCGGEKAGSLLSAPFLTRIFSYNNNNSHTESTVAVSENVCCPDACPISGKTSGMSDELSFDLSASSSSIHQSRGDALGKEGTTAATVSNIREGREREIEMEKEGREGAKEGATGGKGRRESRESVESSDTASSRDSSQSATSPLNASQASLLSNVSHSQLEAILQTVARSLADALLIAPTSSTTASTTSNNTSNTTSSTVKPCSSVAPSAVVSTKVRLQRGESTESMTDKYAAVTGAANSASAQTNISSNSSTVFAAAEDDDERRAQEKRRQFVEHSLGRALENIDRVHVRNQLWAVLNTPSSSSSFSHSISKQSCSRRTTRNPLSSRDRTTTTTTTAKEPEMGGFSAQIRTIQTQNQPVNGTKEPDGKENHETTRPRTVRTTTTASVSESLRLPASADEQASAILRTYPLEGNPYQAVTPARPAIPLTGTHSQQRHRDRRLLGSHCLRGAINNNNNNSGSCNISARKPLRSVENDREFGRIGTNLTNVSVSQHGASSTGLATHSRDRAGKAAVGNIECSALDDRSILDMRAAEIRRFLCEDGTEEDTRICTTTPFSASAATAGATAALPHLRGYNQGSAGEVEIGRERQEQRSGGVGGSFFTEESTATLTDTGAFDITGVSNQFYW